MPPAATSMAHAMHDRGDGTPLVLLHSVGSSWQVWQPVLPLLEPHHRVIALTLPGHDGGRVLSAAPSIAGMADTVLQQLRELGLSSAHVAGNSLGGWLALELQRRGFARSVTALSPAGAWSTPADLQALARRIRFGHTLGRLVLARVPGLFRMAWARKAALRHAMKHGDRVDPAGFRVMLRSLARARVLPALIDAVRRDGPIVPLRATTTPIRIAWGRHDRVLPFERYGRPMLASVSSADYRVLNGVGHVPMYDDPSGVAATILEVTARVDDQAQRAVGDRA